MASFVGRNTEFTDLISSVDRAISGQGGNLAVIEGEAGIGKTRLCEELEQYAKDNGSRVVWSQCREESGQPAYWPWTQIVRSLSADDPEGMVLARMQPAARIIAAHIPELANLTSDVTSDSEIETERHQFQLRDSICSLVLAYVAENPLLLMFDDLHWADLSSIATLNMLAERTGAHQLSAVATTRPVEAGSSISTALTGLKRVRGAAWIQLTGLNDVDSQELFESSTPHHGAERGLVEALRISEGNPFFLTELASSWDQLDLNRSLALPASAIDVVNSRLSGMPADAISILHTASVLGREFDIARLIAVSSSIDEGVIADALELGRLHRLIEDREGTQGQCRFIHEITRQVLLRRGSAINRANLHAHIAQELETFLGNAAVENAFDIAFHWREAGSFGDAEKGATWAIVAGVRSLNAYEYSTAFDQFNHAINAVPELTNDHLTAKAQEGFGRSLAALERGGEAVEYLRNAFDYFINNGEPDRAISIAQMYLGSPSGLAGMAPLQRRALEIENISDLDAARIKVPLARSIAITSNDYAPGVKMLQEVVEFAREHSLASLEMYAVGHGTQISGFLRRFSDMRNYGERVLSLGSTIDDPFSTSAACAPLSMMAFFQGRTGEIEALTRRGNDSAARSRVSHRISTANHYEQRIAFERCDWDKARDAASVSKETGFDDPRVLAVTTATEFQLGNSHEGESLLEEFFKSPVSERRVGESTAQFFYLIARATSDPDHRAITRSEAEDAIRASNPLSKTHGLITLGWLAVEQQDAEQANIVREQLIALGLEDFEQAVLPPLAHIAGMPEEAAREFETLLPMFEERQMMLTSAWMKYDFTRFLTDHPEVRPGLSAKALAAEGKEFALARGLVPLADRFQELLGEPNSEQSAHGLSRRELEVLNLLAGGRSNREIASELFISPATVNRHVSNLFTKLGVSNRASATDLAHRSGLVH